MNNPCDFSEKVVLVTGGAGRGGGASGMWISKLFAARGACVSVVDKSGDGARDVAASINETGGRAVAIEADLCDEGQARLAVSKTIEEFGRLDVLVNNAFWHADEQPNIIDYGLDEWDRHIEINLRVPFMMTKFVLPHLIKNATSSIVNIGSTGAHMGEDGYCAYSAAKAGLESLTRSTAVQYGREGVRCNCIVPGLVLSSQMDAWAKSNPSVKRVFDLIDRNMLLADGHGSGRDVAYAVLFVASDEAGYLTGQTIVLDGGTTAHFPQWRDMRG